MNITTTDLTAAALVVTRMRTAADWRAEIGRRLADPRNPAAVQLRVMLDALDEHERRGDQPADALGVLPSAEFYTVYSIRQLLPRHYLVVGWLDDGGYRHAAPTLPVPSEEFLRGEWEEVLVFSTLNRAAIIEEANPETAPTEQLLKQLVQQRLEHVRPN